MEDILDLLGEDGKLIVGLATEYAKMLHHYYLGTEHLFIAMAKLEGSLTQQVLAHFELDPKETRDLLKVAAGPGYRQPLWRGVIGTPRLATTLDLACELAAEEEQPRIGERHLLLAILEDEESLPSRVLQQVGEDKGFDRVQFLAQVRETPWSLPPPGEAPPYDLEASFARPGGPAQFPQIGDLSARRPDNRAVRLGQRGRTPILDKFGRDLTALAKEDKLRRAQGKTARRLMRRIGRVLLQREANNPLLIGEPGVGKTAIVEGFAYRLATEKVVPQLADRRIVELQVNTLLSGTRYRGDLEQRIERVLAEVKANPHVVVFIDEIHAILGGGAGEGLSSLADAIKPALARGEFPCIGATTVAEYRRHIERDAALARRFEAVMVDEPTVKEAKEILQGVAEGLARHHNIEIDPRAVVVAVELSAHYLPDERLPGKAVKLLEQACPRVQIKSLDPSKLVESGLEVPLGDRVTEDAIRLVLAEKIGIPVTRLTTGERERLRQMEEVLKQEVIGQDEAVETVVRAVKRAKAGLADPNRPLGVFIFAGPTGVGKTWLAQRLAAFLFNSPGQIIRLDMSEYMEKHTVSRLIGAPPGYVGHEEGGQLTEKLWLKPYSVVLLDEMEKAHADVYNLFLQVFDAGRLTDARGHTVDARNAIFIMTTNEGAEVYQVEPLGFLPEDLEAKRHKVEMAIKSKFPPEFLNRVDALVHFNPLSPEAVARIFHLQFAELAERLAEQGIGVSIDTAAVKHVCAQGYNATLGARPLRRAIEQLINNPISDGVLDEKYQAGDTIHIDFDGQALTWRKG